MNEPSKPNQIITQASTPRKVVYVAEDEALTKDFGQRLEGERRSGPSHFYHKEEVLPSNLAIQELAKVLAGASGVDLANRQQVIDEILAELRAALDTLPRRSSVACHPSIPTAEIVAEYLESKKPNLSPDTFVTYKDILSSFARAFPNLPTQPELIEGYMAQRRRPAKDGALALKAGTRRLLYSKLSDFYDFAYKRHGVSNVMELIDRPARGRSRESDFLSLEQLRAALEAISRRPRSERLRGYVYLCAGQGLRSEEPLRLNIDDIQEGRLRITGKERTEWTPLLPEVKEALLKICQGRPGHQPIFITETTKVRLGRKMMYNEVRGLLAEAGITGIAAGAKIMRHTFNTLVQLAGCDKTSAKALMRHRTKDVNDVYTHLTVEQRLGLLRPKLEEYSPLRQINGRKPDWTLSTG